MSKHGLPLVILFVHHSHNHYTSKGSWQAHAEPGSNSNGSPCCGNPFIKGKWPVNDKCPHHSISSLLLISPVSLLLLYSFSPVTLIPKVLLHDCKDFLDIFQASHPEFLDNPLLEAEGYLLTYGYRLDSWGSSNYPMGHHIDTSLGTGHINPKTVDCCHSGPMLGKWINIYTDKYAFATVHVHTINFKEKDPLIAEGNTVKRGNSLLEVAWLPKEVAVIHQDAPSSQHTWS